MGGRRVSRLFLCIRRMEKRVYIWCEMERKIATNILREKMKTREDQNLVQSSAPRHPYREA